MEKLKHLKNVIHLSYERPKSVETHEKGRSSTPMNAQNGEIHEKGRSSSL
jgi:hypothetical protein